MCDSMGILVQRDSDGNPCSIQPKLRPGSPITRTHTRKTHRTQTTRKPTMSSQLYIVLSAKCIYLFCLVYGLPCTAFPAGRPAEHQLIAPKKPQPGKLAKRRQAGWFGEDLAPSTAPS